MASAISSSIKSGSFFKCNEKINKSNDWSTNMKKILRKFDSVSSFDDALKIITNLCCIEHPHLFIFSIENENYRRNNPKKSSVKEKWRTIKKKISNIKEKLIIFGKNRPIILHLSCKNNNSSDIYFKDKIADNFIILKKQDGLDHFENFVSFLNFFLNGSTISFENIEMDKLFKMDNLDVIIRLLRNLNFEENFYVKLILKCSNEGTKTQLLASINASFEENEKILNTEAQNYLMSVFDKFDDSSSDDASSDTSPLHYKIHFSNNDSVLHSAVKNKNQCIINFLINFCSHLIQQLPFEHQITVSTLAFESEKYEILCDLLKYSDFPFPNHFNDENIENERLCDVILERKTFENSIKNANLKGVSKFIENNLDLKIVYNSLNISSLKQAADVKKFNVFYYLKSLGFKAPEFEFIEDMLDEPELTIAKNEAAKQRGKNVKQAFSIQQETTELMSKRSGLHGLKMLTKEIESECRKHIKNWYEGIYNLKHSRISNIGKIILDVAVQCEDIKIIFDFDSISDANASLTDQNRLGSFHPISKWIFIGAKFSDKKREQEIKGVLAHELCHYVMRLVFENNEVPYYKHAIMIKKEYERIIQCINKWPTENLEAPDDECNGIISSVFRGKYKANEIHLELIVRVIEILTTFDNDETKSLYLQDKYEMLFEFFEKYIMPECKKFNLKNRFEARKMNWDFDILRNLLSLTVVDKKNFEFLENNQKVVLITTNVPKLFLIGVKNYIYKKLGVFYETQYIFVDAEKLKNPKTLKRYQELLSNNSNLKIFVKYSKACHKEYNKIINCSNRVFIVTKANQNEIVEIAKKHNINPYHIEVNFTWDDLEIESMKKLVNTDIIFQNDLQQVSLIDLFKKESTLEGTTTSNDMVLLNNNLKDFSEIIDEELLNLLMTESYIKINTHPCDQFNNHFDLLFQTRQFNKVQYKNLQTIVHEPNGSLDKNIDYKELSEDQLIKEVEHEKYVLISDIAGSGKSWVMNNISNKLKNINRTHWVAYIDLKKFIKTLKSKESEPKLSSLAVDIFLKLDYNFEAKIFKKMYEIGKVFIFFDGYDEIAPDYAEYVSKLVETFEWNGGNQLWIATRDFYDEHLMERLQLDISYKLDKFTEEYGIDFIAKTWLLKDLNSNAISCKRDFDEILKNSSDFLNYKIKAKKIINKFSMAKFRSIGMPQLYKMIGDIFKENIDAAVNLREFRIFEKFVENLFEKIVDESDIKKRINLKSQRNILSLWKFHQYSAIKNVFPKLLAILFPNYDESEWSAEDIIAYGLMNKEGEFIFFLHETFCEFFIADYICGFLKNLNFAKILLRLNTEQQNTFKTILKLFAKILTCKKFEIIRIFLDDAIDESILNNISNQMCYFIDKFYEIDCMTDLFISDSGKLLNFTLSILKSGDYKKVVTIIDASIHDIIIYVKEDSEKFQRFHAFIFDFLKIDDLKQLIIKKRILQRVIQSELNIENFEHFVREIDLKTNKDFVCNALRLLNEDCLEPNIFYFLIKSNQLSTDKVKRFFIIMQKYLGENEIFEMTRKCNKNDQNILQICVKQNAKENRNVIWTEVENFFRASKNSSSFIEFVMHRDKYRKNILHCAAYSCFKVSYHNILWELLDTTLQLNDLRELVFQKDSEGRNWIHYIVENNSEIVMYQVFSNLKTKFSEDDYLKILFEEGPNKMNLLQFAASYSKNLEIVIYLWESFEKECRNFINFIKSVDETKNNNLNIAFSFSTYEILKFLMENIEKLIPLEVKNLLQQKNSFLRNVLQATVKFNKSLKVHQYMWEIFTKYFEQSELLVMIKNFDNEQRNILNLAINYNIDDVIELTWRNIKHMMSEEEQKEYLEPIRCSIGDNLSFWNRPKLFVFFQDISKLNNNEIYTQQNKGCTVF